MTLPSYTTFFNDLEKMLTQFGYVGTGSAAKTGISANKVLEPSVSKRAALDYQTDNPDKNWFGARPAGFLATYVKTFGVKFSYEGLEFREGQLRSDLAVMKSLLSFHCVELTADGHFLLTEKGRALIAPFHVVSDQQMEASDARR